jgi:hypothetical protein
MWNQYIFLHSEIRTAMATSWYATTLDSNRKRCCLYAPRGAVSMLLPCYWTELVLAVAAAAAATWQVQTRFRRRTNKIVPGRNLIVHNNRHLTRSNVNLQASLKLFTNIDKEHIEKDSERDLQDEQPQFDHRNGRSDKQYE